MNLFHFFPPFFLLPPAVCVDQNCSFLLSLCSVRLKQAELFGFYSVLSRLLVVCGALPCIYCSFVSLHLNAVVRLLRRFQRQFPTALYVTSISSSLSLLVVRVLFAYFTGTSLLMDCNDGQSSCLCQILLTVCCLMISVEKYGPEDQWQSLS